MTDLLQLEKNAREKRKTFTQLLKKSRKPSVIKSLPTLHQKAFDRIDCLDCANCCKNYSPRFRMPDIKRISRHLRMKETVFIDQYLRMDEDGDYVLTTHPCPFLEADNKCMIYDVRPRDCYRYPYTDEDVLVKQVNLTLKNSEICPAVFAVLEMLEKEV